MKEPPERLEFLMQAAMLLAAATESSEGTFKCEHEDRAKWAFDAAEALASEFYTRYIAGEEVDTDEVGYGEHGGGKEND